MRLTAAARMKQAPAAKSAMFSGMILNAIAIVNRIPSVLKTIAPVFALSFVKVISNGERSGVGGQARNVKLGTLNLGLSLDPAPRPVPSFPTKRFSRDKNCHDGCAGEHRNFHHVIAPGTSGPKTSQQSYDVSQRQQL